MESRKSMKRNRMTKFCYQHKVRHDDELTALFQLKRRICVENAKIKWNIFVENTKNV